MTATGQEIGGPAVRPRALDLFCCAGGAQGRSMSVTGVEVGGARLCLTCKQPTKLHVGFTCPPRIEVAALFVATGGVYFGLDGVDAWDITRDAREYAGPYPVVAHPPCERWGRYWGGGPSARVKRTLGADEGCFASALWDVRTYGGVLEHPEASHAWAHHGLNKPPKCENLSTPIAFRDILIDMARTVQRPAYETPTWFSDMRA